MPLMMRLMIMLRILPMRSMMLLSGILSRRGMKLWTLRRTPSWIIVMPFWVR